MKTVAKRKKKKNKAEKKTFLFGRAKKKKAGKRSDWTGLKSAVKVLVALCILAVVIAGFVFLKKQVRTSERTGFLELVAPPVWLNEQLKQLILDAATANGENLTIDKDAAESVQNNIEQLVAWLDDVTVQTTSESFLIKARWRTPLAMVKLGLSKCYVDAELVVLNYVHIPELPIVKVRGLSATRIPKPGEIWNRDDLAAAVALLECLNRRDKIDASEKSLLSEIDRIDMSNFNGRQNGRAPHIILYSNDNTEIIWGSEIGTWQRYLESTDEEKLAKLYSYYKEHGTLSGGVKYINLCDPQDNIPRPIDKY